MRTDERIDRQSLRRVVWRRGVRFATTGADRGLDREATPGRRYLAAVSVLPARRCFSGRCSWRKRRGECAGAGNGVAAAERSGAIPLAQLRTLEGARSATHMAERARSISTLDLADDCARIAAPTLVVTGEPGLDHVVPREGASAYIQTISGARGAVIERTGHLGVITRPDAFASLVRAFVEGQLNAAA